MAQSNPQQNNLNISFCPSGMAYKGWVITSGRVKKVVCELNIFKLGLGNVFLVWFCFNSVQIFFVEHVLSASDKQLS